MVFSLKEFENEYNKTAKKYNLPYFEKLNEDFEIDKIDRETQFILRLVRKVMMEKIINSINFLEMLINPVNTPRIYFSYIKSMPLEDRREIDKMYNILGSLSIASIGSEIDYSEKKEAELINNIFKSWQSVKASFRMIVKNMQKPDSNNGAAKKERSYFG